VELEIPASTSSTAVWILNGVVFVISNPGLVTEVKPVLAAVSVYPVPTLFREIVEKVATPELVDTEVVPPSVDPPGLFAMVRV
jgi:hypothetical protein